MKIHTVKYTLKILLTTTTTWLIIFHDLTNISPSNDCLKKKNNYACGFQVCINCYKDYMH